MPEQHHAKLPPIPLPPGVRNRYINCPGVGLNFHILESLPQSKATSAAASSTSPDLSKSPRLLLLLHGFPELSFSWRRVLSSPSLSEYHIVAPDQRGYGRTTGWDRRDFSTVDLSTFSMTMLVRDMLYLVSALGYKKVDCVVGHDFGAVVAGLCALVRPDVFCSLVLASHPFKGLSELPFATSVSTPSMAPEEHEESDGYVPPTIHEALAHRGLKHYKNYYATAPAAPDMHARRQDVPIFLRQYFYLKSGDWKGNSPRPLSAWTAPELAKMPGYYIMPLDSGMRESCAAMMGKTAEERKQHLQEASEMGERWLNETELAHYAEEYGRNGFQGALNYYRIFTAREYTADLEVFAGRRMTVPVVFIAGEKDWGMYQEFGALEAMEKASDLFKGVKVIGGAGHWVQQEKSEEFVNELLDFLREINE